MKGIFLLNFAAACFILTVGSVKANEFTQLDQSKNRDLQEVVEVANDYYQLFSSTSGSCTQVDQLSFENNSRLKSLVRRAIYQVNTGYDSPERLKLRYLGPLDDENDSFYQSLDKLMGGRQLSFVRHYFQEQDNQDALTRIWIAKSQFQIQLGALSKSSRVLVYLGVSENSFTRTDVTALVDPDKKVMVLFQAGWCE